MCKSFIFVQASVKVIAVLNCYEAEKAKGREVTIILPSYMNKYNIKLFFEGLHLDAHILIFEGFDWNHAILYSFINKRRIKKDLAQMGVDDNSHFFFTDVNEGTIGLLLPFLKKCNPTQILMKQDVIDGPDYQTKYLSSNIRKKIRAKLLSFFYNTHFIAVYEAYFYQLWTDRKAWHLPMIDYSDTSIIEKYQVNVCDSPNSVIFFTSINFNGLYEKEVFCKLNIEIINILHQKGYTVFLKDHPLESVDIPGFKELADEIVPAYIPGEFLDLSSFSFAIGLFSTALATAAEIIPSYSVLNIGNVKDKKLCDFCNNYLKGFNSPLVFLNSLEEIPDIVKTEN